MLSSEIFPYRIELCLSHYIMSPLRSEEQKFHSKGYMKNDWENFNSI